MDEVGRVAEDLADRRTRQDNASAHRPGFGSCIVRRAIDGDYQDKGFTSRRKL